MLSFPAKAVHEKQSNKVRSNISVSATSSRENQRTPKTSEPTKHPHSRIPVPAKNHPSRNKNMPDPVQQIVPLPKRKIPTPLDGRRTARTPGFGGRNHGPKIPRTGQQINAIPNNALKENQNV